jgi:LacI family transcriptional regulator
MAPAVPPPLLKPVEVVTRQSSDVMAVGDPDVAAALRYIRANSRRPLKIASILGSLNVSRRSLEYKFQKELGRTPLQEIHQVQVDRARSLLAAGDSPIRTVAAECGFTTPVQFWSVFKRLVGLSPTEFRRRCR